MTLGDNVLLDLIYDTSIREDYISNTSTYVTLFSF